MKESILRKILIGLMTMFYTMSSMAMDELKPEEMLNETYMNPAGMTCFDRNETKLLADFKKRCDQSKDELDIYKNQYQKCIDKTYCQDSITNQRSTFWSAVVVALGVGVLIGQKKE